MLRCAPPVLAFAAAAFSLGQMWCFMLGMGVGLGNAASVPPGTVVWKADVGVPAASAMFSSDGAMYVFSNDSSIHKLDAVTGVEAWKVSVGVVGTGFTLGSGGELLFFEGTVGGMNSTLYCLNTTSGTVKWQYEAPQSCCNQGGPLDVFVVARDVVVVGTFPDRNENLTAIDIASGSVVWWYGMFLGNGGSITPFLSPLGDAVWGVTEDGNIFGLNVTTGTELWDFTQDLQYVSGMACGPMLLARQSQTSNPFHFPYSFVNAWRAEDGGGGWTLMTTTQAQANMREPLCSPSGRVVYAYDQIEGWFVDSVTGAYLWNYTIADRGSFVFGPDDTVYVAPPSEQNSLAAYSLSDGSSLLWNVTGAAASVLLFPSDNTSLLVLQPVSPPTVSMLASRSGSELWQYTVTSAAAASVSAAVECGAGAVCLTTTTPSQVICLDSSGMEVWTFPAGASSVVSSVTHRAGFIYVVTEPDGALYALAGPTAT